MKITVNSEKREALVAETVTECINAIKAHAEEGIDKTDLYVQKGIARDVRSRLKEEVEDVEFLIVKRAPNEFTGRMNYYTTETIGDESHFRVKV